MNKKKLVSMLVALTLVAAVGVGATLAYFTDNASTENIITLGHVDINLVENEVEFNEETGEYDQLTGEDDITTEGLEFESVVPGQSVPKNPTVIAADGSANCYVRVKVEVASEDFTGDEAQEILDSLALNSGWTKNADDGFYYYGSELVAGDSATLFEKVTIPTTWDNNQADAKFKILISAEAVQSKYLAENVVTKTGVAVTGWSLSTADILAYPVSADAE